MSVPKPSIADKPAPPFNRSAQQAIRELLALMDRETARGLFTYIMTGLPPGILIATATALETRRASLQYGWYSMLREARAVMLTLDRGAVGALDAWDAAATRRLGEVLALILKSASDDKTAAALDYFQALATMTELCLSEWPDNNPRGWLLDGPRCLELLALAGADQSTLVETLFTPFPGPRRRLRYTKLLQMHGLRAVLAAAPERTLQAARALPSPARIRCIKLLESSALRNHKEFSSFLVEAMLRDPKPVAYAAASALAAVPHARSLLEAQLQTQISAAVRRRITYGLQRARLLEHALADTCRDGSGYLSITGEWIAIPPPEPLPPDTPLPAGFEEELRAALLDAGAEARRASEEPPPHEPGERPQNDGNGAWTQLSAGAVADLVHVMRGALAPGQAPHGARQLAGLPKLPGRYWSAAVLFTRRLERLLSGPGITVHHLARHFALHILRRNDNVFELLSDTAARVPVLLRRLALAAGDLRPVLQACGQAGVAAGQLVTELLRGDCPAACRKQKLLWQVLGQDLAPIDETLRQTPEDSGHRLLRALELLALLPATPARHGPILLELATQGAGEEAVRARALLAATPYIEELIVSLLESPEQQLRIAASCWLRERGDRAALPALRAALALEKAQSVRTALLISLAAFQDWEHFCGQSQLKEAVNGLATTKTGLDRCLPLSLLPPLAWANGQQVPEELVPWWVLRAAQLKQPRADPLLKITLDSLEPRCAAQLAWQALSHFVLADVGFQGKRLPRSLFNCEEALRRLSQSARANCDDSAYEHRGILALVPWADPAETAALVRMYVRHHTARRGQCRALLKALAVNPKPPVLELLYEIAHRHRAPRMRTLASELCSAIAKERGWTQQVLEDHAAPTCGLNELGVLELACGGNTYTAELGADLSPVLRDSRRVIVQRVTARGKPASAAQELWQRFRKQLPEIVGEQTLRLQRAMQSGREWLPADFINLLQHPILGRLCQLLIFAGGEMYGKHVTFRPVEDGQCISAASEPVDITGCSRIWVAHRVHMESSEAGVWLRHLEDYKLVPLFAQLY